MAQVVAAALRVSPRPGLSLAGSIVEFLRTKTALLLVLDNCEHLAAAAAALDARTRELVGALTRLPGVRILATSRQALGVSGEQVFGLGPLSPRRHRRRAWRPPGPARRCPCSCSGPPPRAPTSR